MAKIWKNRASLIIQSQHFTKFTSIFHFVWDILLVWYLTTAYNLYSREITGLV